MPMIANLRLSHPAPPQRAARTSLPTLVLILLVWSLSIAPAFAARPKPKGPSEVEFRVRVLALEPTQPAMIHWRWGGEGLGGDVVSGVVTQEKPKAMEPGDATMDVDTGNSILGDALSNDPLGQKVPKDRVIVKGDTWDVHYLNPKVWSPWRSVSTIKAGNRRILVTFLISGLEEGRDIRQCEIEFEFRHGDEVLKTFTVKGPDGPTFGVVIPMNQVDADGVPGPEFRKELGGLDNWVQLKLDLLKKEPWINLPTPKLYGILTDCAGYNEGAGYKIRTTDPATMMLEYEVLATMGLNGLRGMSSVIREKMVANEGLGQQFKRVSEGHTIGYPIPRIDVGDGRKPFRSPNDGCPVHPDNLAGIEKRSEEAANEFLATMSKLGVNMAFGLTVDEIGPVVGGTPEGKMHPGGCPYCREALRDMIKADGRTPADFGATSWDAIRSTYGYWSYNYWQSHDILTKAVADAEDAAKASAWSDSAATALTADPDAMTEEQIAAELSDAPRKKADPAQALLTAQERLDSLEWNGRPLEVPEAERKLGVSEEGWRLLEYYSRIYNGDSSAELFKPVREAYEAHNAKKRAALAAGETDTAVAKQPWIYSFALRGNTFLMGGSTLDFFDFYRHADNAMVYETSNRDSRIWHWDSYLCDVGRSLHRFENKEFGIYVKPHRGAGTQRVLSSIARGARMVFWYTYGPEWAKGDTFGGDEQDRRDIAWSSRLIAAAEDVTYDADWAIPAEVAIVRPRTSEFFSGSASWENGKWLYSALAHAHIPVDPLDEHLIETLDLSAYKVIVIAGSHLRRASTEVLTKWVEAGGTLYTCGWGMARDEADLDVPSLYPFLGLESRTAITMWGDVPRYGATKLGAVRPDGERPEWAVATAAKDGLLRGTVTPAAGGERLVPLAGTEVLASWADGSAAATRHRQGKGKGTVYVIGTYPGVEYASAGPMAREPYDAELRSWVSGPILAAGVRPVVDASVPEIEGILMQNRKTNRQAIILMNWATDPTVKDSPVTIRVRGIPAGKGLRSLALRQPLAVQADGDWLTITLPSITDGDILLVE